MTTPTPEPAPATYATAELVRNVLGTIGKRLPEWVDVDNQLVYAHAVTVDVLSSVYPNGIPAFAGAGLNVVELAEAKYAAAEILDAIRVNLPDVGDRPDQLRASATKSLTDGVAGYAPGTEGSVTDNDGDPTGVQVYGPGPRVSSFTSASAFPDPYEAVRGLTGETVSPYRGVR